MAWLLRLRLLGACVARLVPIALFAVFAAVPADARWLEAESPLFRVYSEGGAGKLRAFIENLERYDALLRLETGTTGPPPANKLEIYIVDSAQDLGRVDPGLKRLAAGFYSAGPRGIFAIVNLQDTNENWAPAQAVIFHEYTHYFVSQYYPGAYPTWFNEGFAEYFSTTVFKYKTVEVGQAMPDRLYPLQRIPWEPIRLVIAPPGDYRDNVRDEMFYPESWLATHYVLRKAGAPLKAYLLALRKGDAPATAFTNAFGMDFAVFDKTLHAYFDGGMTYTILNWAPPAPPAIAITPMPPSADKLLLMRARMLTETEDRGDDAAFLEQVRAAAAEFPDDALALQTLAMAEIYYGDFEKADAALDRLSSAHPDDVEGNYLRGLRFWEAAFKTPKDMAALIIKARPFLAKVYKRDPNHYQALYLYAKTFLAEGGAPSENTINILLTTHDLAPQVDEITYTTARALQATNNWAAAKPLFESVAYEPHPNSLSVAALKALHPEADNPQQAIISATAALKVDPTNFELLTMRAQAYAGTKQTDAASQDFAAARAVAAKDRDRLNELCWAQAINNFALDMALRDCDAALANRPNFAAALDSRAFVLLRLGRFAEAVSGYDAALKAEAQNASSLYGRALAEQQLGLTAQAEADLSAARALEPGVDDRFKRYGIS